MKDENLKTFSLNHMKLVLVNSRHNFFHCLVVVLIRIIYFLIFVTLSIYLMAIGFLLSLETIQVSHPTFWIKTGSSFLGQLPYYYTIKQSVFNQLNHWYKDAPVWWAMVVGLPLMAMGISLFWINFFNLFHSVFNRLYNRTHCPFCKRPISAKKNLA